MHTLLENRETDVITNLKRAQKLEERDEKIIKAARQLLFQEENIARQKKGILFGNEEGVFKALHLTKSDLLKTIHNYSKHYTATDEELGAVKWDQNEELKLVRQFRVMVDVQAKIVDKEISFEKMMSDDGKKVMYIAANMKKLTENDRKNLEEKIKKLEGHLKAGNKGMIKRFMYAIKMEAKSIVENKRIMGYDDDLIEANKYANKYLDGIKENIREQLDRINITKALIETAAERKGFGCSTLYKEIQRHVEALIELVKQEIDYNKKFEHAVILEKKFNKKLEHHLADEIRSFFKKKYDKLLK